jgi:hypothetical protein
MSQNSQQPRRITNFNKSFKPRVPLPRDGKPCRLHRHYRNALRQVVSRLDYLAGLDETGERFVYATVIDLQKHCKDFETGKPYSIRILEACLRYLRSQKVASEYSYRFRKEAMRGGRVIAEHDRITEIIEGKICAFCIEKLAVASVSASVGASGHASVGASVESEKCFGLPPSSCFGLSEPKPVENAEDARTAAKFCKDGFESFASANSGKSIESIESIENKTAKAATAPPLVPDLTKKPDMEKELTVGSRLAEGELTLEFLLDLISDGEFETPALQKYEYCSQLKDASLDVLERFKDEPLSDRIICLRMFKALMNACERAGFPWPRGCPKVRKILEQGGPIRFAPVSEEAQHDHYTPAPGSHNALLEARYAAGEITQEQYEAQFDWDQFEQELAKRDRTLAGVSAVSA